METESLESIETSNTLKGIAISAVLINHYLNLNVSGDSRGFANAWIAVFFFVSGYGLFHSLNRRHLSNARELLAFYYQRTIRIFPLLWVAWIIGLIVRGGKMSPWILTGIHASGHFWFIPALLQCYLVSPVIYLGIKKKSILSLFAFLLMLVLINFLGYQAPPIITKWASFFHLRWREIYLLHILVFLCGMLTPSIINIPSKKRDSGSLFDFLFWLFIFFITMFMVFLKLYSQANPILKFSFNIVPLFLMMLLCVYSLYFSVRNQFLEYLGSISYSIYLLHMFYYLLISDIGAFPNNSIKELIACIVFFPIFIILCRHIENLGGYINRKLRPLVIMDPAQRS